MTSFSSLLSSIGVDTQAPQQTPATSRQPNAGKAPEQKPGAVASAPRLSSNNVAAGVKRKAIDGDRGSRPVASDTRQGNAKGLPANAPQAGRAQQAIKNPVIYKPGQTNARAAGPTVAIAASSPNRNARSISKHGAASSATASSTRPPASAAPAKRGYAYMMERAKAAQEALKAAGPGGIKHKPKPVERVSNREKQRQLEEQKAQQKTAKRGVKASTQDRSRSGTPATAKITTQKKVPEVIYKGTMKKTLQEAPQYKVAMRASTPGNSKTTAKKKSEPEGKYGGYANWSDLDDADDDEDDDDSEGSSDMEGGFDDMEQEEMRALRAAKQEDQAALEEEEKHRREKLERKRRLEALSKTAAAKRRY